MHPPYKERIVVQTCLLTDYITDVFNATKSLLKGMRRTGYYFTHHKEIITQQYPDVSKHCRNGFAVKW